MTKVDPSLRVGSSDLTDLDHVRPWPPNHNAGRLTGAGSRATYTARAWSNETCRPPRAVRSRIDPSAGTSTTSPADPGSSRAFDSSPRTAGAQALIATTTASSPGFWSDENDEWLV